MFKILILVFQMDINCILMKYYFNVYDHNSCFSKGFYLHFNEILFLMFKIIIHVFQIENICINEILFECLRL